MNDSNPSISRLWGTIKTWWGFWFTSFPWATQLLLTLPSLPEPAGWLILMKWEKQEPDVVPGP